MTGRSVSAVSAYTAHREWASRPPDERYASVHALYEAARARRQQLEERTVETGEFRTEAVDDDLAFRLWCLRREELVSRFTRLGVAVGRWNGESPIGPLLEEVRVFRRHAGLVPR